MPNNDELKQQLAAQVESIRTKIQGLKFESECLDMAKSLQSRAKSYEKLAHDASNDGDEMPTAELRKNAYEKSGIYSAFAMQLNELADSCNNKAKRLEAAAKFEERMQREQEEVGMRRGSKFPQPEQ